jgi:hypothetical protein
MMVPEGETRTALVTVNPASVASQIKLTSREPHIANLSPPGPLTLSTSPETFTVKGVSSGSISTEIIANKADPLGKLAISVKPNVTKTVELFAIKEANTGLGPQNVPNPAALEDYLNRVWGKQANVFFSVNPVETRTIHYDLDNDGKLNNVFLLGSSCLSGSEIGEICSVAGSVSADFRIYYVRGVTVPAASSDRPSSTAFVGDLHSASSVNVTAHEIGHLLGIAGHSSDPEDLMFATAQATNPCRLRESDWDTANH